MAGTIFKVKFPKQRFINKLLNLIKIDLFSKIGKSQVVGNFFPEKNDFHKVTKFFDFE